MFLHVSNTLKLNYNPLLNETTLIRFSQNKTPAITYCLDTIQVDEMLEAIKQVRNATPASNESVVSIKSAFINSTNAITVTRSVDCIMIKITGTYRSEDNGNVGLSEGFNIRLDYIDQFLKAFNRAETPT